jgi:hypothetical protein
MKNPSKKIPPKLIISISLSTPFIEKNDPVFYSSIFLCEEGRKPAGGIHSEF